MVPICLFLLILDARSRKIIEPITNTSASVYQHMFSLSTIIFEVLCDYLDIPHLSSLIIPESDVNVSSSTLRILRYPSETNRDRYYKSKVIEYEQITESEHLCEKIEIVAADHTDIGFITIMACSDIPGLQVLQGDEWVGVEQIIRDADIPPNEILFVISGEQMNYLSNGTFPAIRHRVIRSNREVKDRISFPFFYRMGPKHSINKFENGHCLESCLAKNITPNLY
eukprot:TRINITY_DN786_c0_g1_i3.p1 TRINITY_DN786_c0_g1~~TRINITY_DN786_c0_g1_i3.p1  ORF type:complete len:226 (+),score=26.82 TRINITY_DN786_c0_g1_i3:313-990(+)